MKPRLPVAIRSCVHRAAFSSAYRSTATPLHARCSAEMLWSRFPASSRHNLAISGQRCWISSQLQPKSTVTPHFSGVAALPVAATTAPVPAHAEPPKAPAYTPWNAPEESLMALESAAAISHTRPARQILVGSIVGGALLGFGCSFTVLAVGGLPGLAAMGPAAPQLVSGALFPIGLSMILLSKAELATGNHYYTSLPMFNPSDPRPLADKLKAAVRVVSLSGLGNFIGCAAVAGAMSAATMLGGDPWAAYGAALAYKKASLPVSTLFVRAVLTNSLVNLAIFQAAGEKTGPAKMVALWTPIMLFVAFGLEHSIANMWFFPYAIFSGGDVPLLGALKNLAVVFAGNWVGAALLMGGLHRYHLLKGWARAGSAAAGAAGAAGAGTTAVQAGAGTAATVSTLQGLLAGLKNRLA